MYQLVMMSKSLYVVFYMARVGLGVVRQIDRLKYSIMEDSAVRAGDSRQNSRWSLDTFTDLSRV